MYVMENVKGRVCNNVCPKRVFVVCKCRGCVNMCNKGVLKEQLRKQGLRLSNGGSQTLPVSKHSDELWCTTYNLFCAMECIQDCLPKSEKFKKIPKAPGSLHFNCLQMRKQMHFYEGKKRIVVIGIFFVQRPDR